MRISFDEEKLTVAKAKERWALVQAVVNANGEALFEAQKLLEQLAAIDRRLELIEAQLDVLIRMR